MAASRSRSPRHSAGAPSVLALIRHPYRTLRRARACQRASAAGSAAFVVISWDGDPPYKRDNFTAAIHPSSPRRAARRLLRGVQTRPQEW